ncbi:MAG: hypothetical protein A3F90_08410 [Deltaproteobacteria bacterium RIFCSPLOWO2_12_FULL_60_19]|nr:MAG: hypothetical protein A3F90_08410 [Deltaproteobacteria bacterium RIFCSPLOWO2_12_FULL_60_19]
MSEPVVRIENLSKAYGIVTALDGISLEVKGGKIFGLLGPNGAGKTTTVKILATLIRPDGGKAEVAGVDVLTDPAKARSLVGYISQELTVDPYLTPLEHLRYYADLYHVPAALRQLRIRDALALVGLAGLEDRRARHLSGGTKKKLDLACGLIHRPPVIILDEPSLGLDVEVRRDVWNHILRLKEEGTTIFLCTNYMDEAERLCDELAIIDHGKIAALGSPAELKGRLKREIVSVEVARGKEASGEWLATLETAAARLSMVRKAVKDGAILKLYVDNNEAALPKILEAAASLKIPLESIAYSRPGLDEVFLHFTGRAFARGGENDG